MKYRVTLYDRKRSFFYSVEFFSFWEMSKFVIRNRGQIISIKKEAAREDRR